MNKVSLLIGTIIIHFFTSCNKSEDFPNHPLVGTTQIIKTKCIPFEFDKASKKTYGVDYNLVEKRPNNDWRESGWIPVGSEIKITKVSKRRDLRGEFIAVFGIAPLPDGKPGELDFVYYWSTGELLKRAPWEDSSVPEKRKTDLLSL